ncbi:MAG: type II secretion system protein [Thermoleophilia bacterium]|nr:type II secretion system protein [Thermoleophilia bacterium]
MTPSLDSEGGYSMIELVIVMAILTVVIGSIVALFTAGINSDADSSRRFQAQQEVRLSLDKLRRELHAGCTVSNPTTYNTWESSVTVYFPSDNCASGSHSVTWCTVGSGTRYALYRIVATSCTGATQKFADYLTAGSIFVYLPPNSHLATSTSLGQGTAGSAIVTQDGSAVLPRVHVDLTSNLNPAKVHDGYPLADDIVLRNSPRACGAGVASC